jgi:signal peptidase II
MVVVLLDQWAKSLIVANLSPPGSKPEIPLIGRYLVIEYIQNRGAAFGFFANNIFLVVLIAAAIGVISYLYVRMFNSGPLAYKLIFGLIIGGAAGNLVDRVRHGGYVVDFISFRIPEINYYFAIFNVADACISVGVFFLLMLVLFGGFNDAENAKKEPHTTKKAVITSAAEGGDSRSTE